MKNFFIFKRAYDSYRMNISEQIIPLIIMIIIIGLLLLYRDRIRINSRAEKIIRYILTSVSGVFFISYYLANWMIIGIELENLPLHLCYISNILCIILGINKNKKIYNFTLCYGLIGGIGSLLSMDTSLSSRYFKYYQFMVSHISIIVIPLYFLIIHKYFLNEMEVLKVYIMLQIIGITMGVFNHIFNTDYFFVTFNSNLAARGTILEDIGSGYNYFINLELLSLIYMGIIYIIVKIVNKKIIKAIEDNSDFN